MSYSGSQISVNGSMRRSVRLLVKKWEKTAPFVLKNKDIQIDKLEEDYSIIFTTLLVHFKIDLDVNSTNFVKSAVIPEEVLHMIFKFLSLDDLLHLIEAQCYLSEDCQSFVSCKYTKQEFRSSLIGHLWQKTLGTCGYCKECNAINEHWPNIYVCENSCNNKIYRPNLEIRGKNLFIELGCPFAFDDTKISFLFSYG